MRLYAEAECKVESRKKANYIAQTHAGVGKHVVCTES